MGGVGGTCVLALHCGYLWLFDGFKVCVLDRRRVRELRDVGSRLGFGTAVAEAGSCERDLRPSSLLVPAVSTTTRDLDTPGARRAANKRDERATEGMRSDLE